MFTGNILKQPAFRKIICKTPLNDYPVTDHVMKSAFLVGCHHGLTKKHLDYLESIFKKFLSNYVK
ncbi:hypothetical protein ACFL3E_02265 [Patescibacteria group bacterium]